MYDNVRQEVARKANADPNLYMRNYNEFIDYSSELTRKYPELNNRTLLFWRLLAGASPNLNNSAALDYPGGELTQFIKDAWNIEIPHDA